MQVPDCYYRVSVKALVLDDEGRFLLLKEKSGLWDTPGGGLEFGENPNEALKRELDEEIGVEIEHQSSKPEYFIPSYLEDYDTWYADVFYLTKLKSLNFKLSDECVGSRFFTPEEAAKENIHQKVKEFIKYYNPDNHKL